MKQSTHNDERILFLISIFTMILGCLLQNGVIIGTSIAIIMLLLITHNPPKGAKK